MNFSDFLHNAKAFENASDLFDIEEKKPPLFFLASGYGVEYVMIEGRRKVIRFVDANQFLLRFSTNHYLEVGAGSRIVTLSWPNLIIMLRKFQETAKLHKAIKESHFEQIKIHKDDLNKSPAERYFSLLETQPWVIKKVDPKDIASYLNLSLEQYSKLRIVD